MPYNDYPASATRINVSNCGLYMKYSLLSPFSLFVSDRQVFLPLAVSSMRGQNVQYPQSYLPHIIFGRAAQIFPTFLLFLLQKYSQAILPPPVDISLSYTEKRINTSKCMCIKTKISLKKGLLSHPKCVSCGDCGEPFEQA